MEKVVVKKTEITNTRTKIWSPLQCTISHGKLQSTVTSYRYYSKLVVALTTQWQSASMQRFAMLDCTGMSYTNTLWPNEC